MSNGNETLGKKLECRWSLDDGKLTCKWFDVSAQDVAVAANGNELGPRAGTEATPAEASEAHEVSAVVEIPVNAVAERYLMRFQELALWEAELSALKRDLEAEKRQIATTAILVKSIVNENNRLKAELDRLAG